MVSGDDRCLGFFCEEPTPRKKIIEVVKTVKHFLLLADDLTPKQAAVVLTALLILIHDREISVDGTGG